MNLEELRNKVSERADQSQDLVFAKLITSLQKRHCRGGVPDCQCTYCKDLPRYVRSILDLRRAKRKTEWGFVNWMDEHQNLYDSRQRWLEAKERHNALKMLGQDD